MAAVGIRPADASPPGLKAHPPILIDGPYAFTSANGVTSGSGTAKDPYTIQGWSIDASTANGIEIRNIPNYNPNPPAYFVIRNVFIHSNNSNNGVVLNSVSSPPYCPFSCPYNGVIANSTIAQTANGISIINSNQILISSVTIHNAQTGVNCVNSIFLQFNTDMITDSGTGVSLHCAVTNVFYNRILDSDNGIVIGNYGSIDIEHNYIASPRGVALLGGGDTIVANNQIIGAAGPTVALYQYGIHMIAADTTSINSNNITNTGPTQSQSAPAGIKIDGCPTDPVTGQTNPCYTTITGNTLSVGNATGIAAYSANGVQVYHNNFLKNLVQAFDQTGQNAWDNGYPSGGNFWSDYPGVDDCSGPQQNICPSPDGIGDTPYVFNYNQDHYPLMTPVQ